MCESLRTPILDLWVLLILDPAASHNSLLARLFPESKSQYTVWYVRIPGTDPTFS